MGGSACGGLASKNFVDLRLRTCTCRKWELTGIPCKHVIASLNDKADHGEQVGELYTYVHRVHWLNTWKQAYTHKVEPIKGRPMWPISDSPVKILPPIHHTQPGRPKKNRRQSAEEKLDKQGNLDLARGTQVAADGSGKLTRKYISETCKKCGNKGHNSRTCKGQGGQRVNTTAAASGTGGQSGGQDGNGTASGSGVASNGSQGGNGNGRGKRGKAAASGTGGHPGGQVGNGTASGSGVAGNGSQGGNGNGRGKWEKASGAKSSVSQVGVQGTGAGGSGVAGSGSQGGNVKGRGKRGANTMTNAGSSKRGKAAAAQPDH